MKKTSALVASLILGASVLSSSQAFASAQTTNLDMNLFTTHEAVAVQQGDVVHLTISNLGSGNGVYVTVCDASFQANLQDPTFATKCDQSPSSIAWLVEASSPGATLASAGADIAMHANFGTTHCLEVACRIWISGDHDHFSVGQFLRPIPLTFTRATATVKLTVPAASKFKVGKTVAIAKSAAVSNVGAVVALGSTTTKICTVKKTTAGWNVKVVKAGKCTLKATTKVESHGAYTSATLSKSVTAKK